MPTLFNDVLGFGAAAGSAATAWIIISTRSSQGAETGHQFSRVADAVDSGWLGLGAELCPWTIFFSTDSLALSSILSGVIALGSLPFQYPAYDWISLRILSINPGPGLGSRRV